MFKRILLSTVFLIAVQISFSSHASLSNENEDINLKSDSKNIVEVKIKLFEAKDRLKFIQNLLSENNEITMITPIKEPLYKIYQMDLGFIRQEIKNYDNENKNWYHSRDKEEIIEALDYLDDIINKKFKEEMCLADYSFVGLTWAKILAREPIKIGLFTLKHMDLQWYEEALTLFKEKKQISSWRSFAFVASPHLIIPHVSETGCVPIPIMNTGMGFWTNETEKKANALWFFAVGTNKFQDFDYLRENNPFDLYRHDREHWERSGYLEFPERIWKVAVFRGVLEKEITDENEKNKTALAFFHFFHERQTSYDKIMKILKEKIKEFKDAPKQFYRMDISDYSFEGQRMMESYLKAAESLNLVIEGKDIYEKKKNFIDTLYEGYELLLKHAESYDAL